MTNESSIIGYHGTDNELVNSILENHFEISMGEKQWLGRGVYFFVNGVCDEPETKAMKWSIANAWDNKAKTHTYDKYAVLKAEIMLDGNLFDLTCTEGKKCFEYARQEILKKIRMAGKNPRFKYFDSTTIDYLRNSLGFEIVISDFFIKFSQERIENLCTRMPNTTVVSVINPEKNIRQDSIALHSKGEIKNELR